MRQRIITGIIASIIFFPIVLLGNEYSYAGIFSFISLVGVFEMLRCTGLHKTFYVSVPVLIVGGLMPLLTVLLPVADLIWYVVGIAIVLALYLFGAVVLSGGKVPIDSLCVMSLFCLYISTALTGTVRIYLYYHDQGVYFYMFPFLVAWITDIFAYFTGRLLGRHQLCPDISPKKTIEGSIGGVVFAVGFSLLYAWIVQLVSGLQPNYWVFAIVSFFMSVVSQIGDLILSVVKRHYAVKDYGRILPGHGGILDRFDSLLPVFILQFLMMHFVEFFL